MGKKLFQMGNEATPFEKSKLTHSNNGHLCLGTHTNIYQKHVIITLRTPYPNYTPIPRPHISYLPEYQTQPWI